jgi:hypothetical protein
MLPAYGNNTKADEQKTAMGQETGPSPWFLGVELVL